MTNLKYLLNAFFLLLLITQQVHSVALSDGVEVDHIVAIVNDDLITRNELDLEINRVFARIKESGREVPPRSAIESQVLEKLITIRLQLNKAKSLGISATPEMLASAIGKIAKRNNLTLAELRSSLAAQGQSFEEFRDQLKQQFLLSRLKNQEIINKINVSDAEIESLLKQDKQIGQKNVEYNLQHILISLPEGASSEDIRAAYDKANSLIAQIKQGADFGNLALMHSSGKNSLEGGNLGWLKISQLPSLFSDAAIKMNKGDISEPLRSSSGFHILRMNDIKGNTRKLINQTKARHILIKTGEMVSNEDARTRLEQLYFRLEGGDDFSKLARSHSDDKASAIKGGDLGWVGPGSVVKLFQQEMDKLQPGQFSKPFKTEFGWHIVQVLDRRQHDNSEQVLKAQARKIIVDRKAKDAQQLYLRRLRDEAYIEIRLNEE